MKKRVSIIILFLLVISYWLFPEKDDSFILLTWENQNTSRNIKVTYISETLSGLEVVPKKPNSPVSG